MNRRELFGIERELYRAESERLPKWYGRRFPLFFVWQVAKVDQLVYNHWLPGLRGFYSPFSRGNLGRDILVRFFEHGLHFQIAIQERMKIMGSEKRSVAVRAWANYTLTEDDKTAISEMGVSAETLLQDFGALVFSGYRLSLTYDDFSDSLQASLVCGNDKDRNYGLGLSARNPDPLVALTTLMYKHQVLLADGWEPYTKRRVQDSWG